MRRRSCWGIRRHRRFSDYFSTGDEADSPSVTNEVITLVKDTSLAFTISVLEMFAVAKALASSPDKPDSVCGGGTVLLHI